MVDIPGDSSTTRTIAVGGSVADTLEFIGDHDWFRITLTAGQSISIFLDGLSLEDPYLRVRDSSGNLLYENDDINTGINRDSQLAFTATYTGVYYIDVGAWDEDYTGTYQLNVTTYTPPPLATVQDIANQLVEGYWSGNDHHFNATQGGSISVNITALTPAGQNLARAALATWTDIIGVTFPEVTSGAQIVFDDNQEGAFSDGTWSNGIISSAFVNVSIQWLANYGFGLNTYSFQTYIHEIGHALGLGHAGNYNETARYPYEASFQNDGWPLTIMSYFDQVDNTYFAGQGFNFNFLTTPMMADIYAMSLLYGLSTTTRVGDTVYGPSWTSSMGAICLFDSGGNDTIDCSANGITAQTIDLNPGTFSNVLGEVGNVSIALGVIIENAIGGDGSDTLIGNGTANMLQGNDGSDTLTGGAGGDTFQGTAAGLNGDTITDLTAGDKIVITNANLAGFSFSLVGNTLNYTGGALTLTGFTGQLSASAAAGGGVQLTMATAAVDALNDFNGDGRSDILWRSDSGLITDWLGQANGGFAVNWANFGGGVSAEWQVAGTGDFNSDGRDDILWRHSDGTITDWLGNASGGFAHNWANFGAVVPGSWVVAGTGDFNGDGHDDILWRNSDGTVTNWLGNASGGFAPNWSAFNSAVPTFWQVVGVGDFNGDGRADILWRHDYGTVTDWLGQANGGFVTNMDDLNELVALDWSIVGTGDFNGDGRDDILWRNEDGLLTDWLGNANGGFTDNSAAAAIGIPTDWHVAQIGDFNGDGRDDILWRNDSGLFDEWLGAANGAFAHNAANVGGSVPIEWQIQAPEIQWV